MEREYKRDQAIRRKNGTQRPRARPRIDDPNADPEKIRKRERQREYRKGYKEKKKTSTKAAVMETVTQPVTAEPSTSALLNPAEGAASKRFGGERLVAAVVERLSPLKLKIKLKLPASSTPNASTLQTVISPPPLSEAQKVDIGTASRPDSPSFEPLRSTMGTPRDPSSPFMPNFASTSPVLSVDRPQTPQDGRNDQGWEDFFHFDDFSGGSPASSSRIHL